MKSGRRLVLLFVAAAVIVMTGALFKVLHYPFADELLLLGMVVQLVVFVLFLWRMTDRKES